MIHLSDNHGAQEAINERRRRELQVWNDKHKDEIAAVVLLQATYRGSVGRRIYKEMQRADREHRAQVRKTNRLNFQKRMAQRANMLGAMSLGDRRAKEEQARLEKQAYMAALKINMDMAKHWLAGVVREAREKEKNSAGMVAGFAKKNAAAAGG
mgnify:CR=1 FL=1